MTLYDLSFNLCESNKVKVMADNKVTMFENDDALYEFIKANQQVRDNPIAWLGVKADGTLEIRVKGTI